MNDRPPSPPASLLRSDTTRALVVVFGFAVALGGTSVIYPLLALDAGYSASVVGLLTSVSAGAQLTARIALPWLLSVTPDRTLIGAASLIMVASAVALLTSDALAAFVVAQVLQGAARALFWTSSQSHMVRSPGSPVSRLAQVAVASKVGGLCGPVLAGTIATISLGVALWVTVAGGVIAAAASMLMARRAPYVREPRQQRRGTWRRRDLAAGYWTGFASGGWRGILDSYVPVVLSVAGLGAGPIGWLVSLTEAAHLGASTWLARSRNVSLRLLMRVAAASILGGVLVLPLVANAGALPAGLALAVAGFGGGLAATVGPAIANHSASASEQGTVLAITGAYRSAARMVSPSAVAGVGSFAGISVALGAVTLCLVAPALVLGGGEP